MHAEELLENIITVEAPITVDDKLRWIGHSQNQTKPLLIIELADRYYAVPLYCSHAHASLLRAKINKEGFIVCPKHGLATDIKTNPDSFEVIRHNHNFRVKERHADHIPVVNVESGLCEAGTDSEIEVLKTVNTALQQKVLTNLESMDLMLSQVEHKKAELEEKNFNLSSANELIDGITNSIEEFLAVTDNQGRITRINRYAENILQCRSEQLIGTSPDSLLQDQSLSDIVDHFPTDYWDQRPYLYKAVYKESHFQKEVVFRDPLGANRSISNKTFLLKGTLLYSKAGKEEGLILTATDISVIKAKEQQKRQQDLQDHLLLLKGTLETLGQGVAMFASDGSLQLWNRPIAKPDETIIATHAESDVNSVEDLQPGSSLYATDDPDVNRIGMIMLEPADLDQSNTETTTVDSYVIVAKNVLNKSADAGFFLKDAYEELSELIRKQMKVLVSSEISVVHHTLLVGPKLQQFAPQIQQHLLDMTADEKGRGVLESMNLEGWEVMSEEETEFMIDLIDTLID